MQSNSINLPTSDDNPDTRANSGNQASTDLPETLQSAAEAAGRPLAKRIASDAHRAVDMIASAASQTADSIESSVGQIRGVQGRAFEQCRDYVRDNPLTSLGLAVGVGALLSRLMRTRQS